MPYISNYGSKEQIERFIPDMTAGRCIGAIAMTEPGAGRSGSERTQRRLRVYLERSDEAFDLLFQ